MPDTDKIRSEVEAIGKYARECGMLRLEPNYADFITNIRLIVQEELATLLAPAPDGWVEWIEEHKGTGYTNDAIFYIKKADYLERVRELGTSAAPTTPETLVITCKCGNQIVLNPPAAPATPGPGNNRLFEGSYPHEDTRCNRCGNSPCECDAAPVPPAFIRYDKYEVTKLADADKYLSPAQKQAWNDIIRTIQDGREADGKIRCNSYVVVNQDMPYAETIWQLIQEHEEARISGGKS